MTATIPLTDDRIKCLLCSALEGGSNYWYLIDRYEFAPGLKYADFKEDGKMQGEDYWHPAQLIPLAEGCAVIMLDNEAGRAKQYRLDRAAIERGIAIMAEKYPQHFADVIAENEDATTGDVFLQCCIFGNAIYG